MITLAPQGLRPADSGRSPSPPQGAENCAVLIKLISSSFIHESTKIFSCNRDNIGGRPFIIISGSLLPGRLTFNRYSLIMALCFVSFCGKTESQASAPVRPYDDYIPRFNGKPPIIRKDEVVAPLDEREKKLLDALCLAPNWSELTHRAAVRQEFYGPNAGVPGQEELLKICLDISKLPTEKIRNLILAYKISPDWNKGEWINWTKIYILNRVCFDISNKIELNRLKYHDFLYGRIGSTHPYSLDEIVDGAYPVLVADGHLEITGRLYEFFSQRINDSDPSYHVLEEFDFFVKNIPRRKF